LSVTFDGSGSSTTNGNVTSWEWTFGDGDTGTGTMATHTYTTQGNYTATLTVTDSSGATGTATASIMVGSLPPEAPTQLTAFGLTRTSIRLNWTNGSISQTEISIERCARPVCLNFVQVALISGSATTFTDTGLTAATPYRYRVRAHNAAGDSAYSNIAQGRIYKR
jgi:PKD repeat protein